MVRDAVFFGKKTFREFLASEEKIASNILADRLRRLVDSGVLRKEKASKEGGDGRQVIYRVSTKGLDLIPVLIEIIQWSAAHDPKTAAPPAFLRRLKRDRRALMGEFRSRVIGSSE